MDKNKAVVNRHLVEILICTFCWRFVYKCFHGLFLLGPQRLLNLRETLRDTQEKREREKERGREAGLNCDPTWPLQCAHLYRGVKYNGAPAPKERR